VFCKPQVSREIFSSVFPKLKGCETDISALESRNHLRDRKFGAHQPFIGGKKRYDPGSCLVPVPHALQDRRNGLLQELIDEQSRLATGAPIEPSVQQCAPCGHPVD